MELTWDAKCVYAVAVHGNSHMMITACEDVFYRSDFESQITVAVKKHPPNVEFGGSFTVYVFDREYRDRLRSMPRITPAFADKPDDDLTGRQVEWHNLLLLAINRIECELSECRHQGLLNLFRGRITGVEEV